MNGRASPLAGGAAVSVAGAEGALAVDDAHADFIPESGNPLASHRGEERRVRLLGSYPAAGSGGRCAMKPSPGSRISARTRPTPPEPRDAETSCSA